MDDGLVIDKKNSLSNGNLFNFALKKTFLKDFML